MPRRSGCKSSVTLQCESLRSAVSKLLLVMLLLSMSLVGCATNSIYSEQHCPRLPEKPALQEPMPSQGYLKSALEDIEAWRKKLRVISTTP